MTSILAIHLFFLAVCFGFVGMVLRDYLTHRLAGTVALGFIALYSGAITTLLLMAPWS